MKNWNAAQLIWSISIRQIVIYHTLYWQMLTSNWANHSLRTLYLKFIKSNSRMKLIGRSVLLVYSVVLNRDDIFQGIWFILRSVFGIQISSGNNIIKPLFSNTKCYTVVFHKRSKWWFSWFTINLVWLLFSENSRLFGPPKMSFC